jgi:hypothetical protein
MANSLRMLAAEFDPARFDESKRYAQGAMFGPGQQPTHRYALWRNWETPICPGPKRVLWIALNPSTADEHIEDPTVRRMIRFSQTWGYGGLFVCNAFAWRSTDRSVLPKVADPIGPWNDRVILSLAQRCDDVVCAWGADGNLFSRGRVLTDLLRRTATPLWMLARNANGTPKHPLYVHSEQVRQKFTAQDEAAGK